eukprot:m.77143 g.77143  ORF g.77143 m.77143 type:complete len:349 (-) comp7907_c0_seq3:718-1764(-)
MLCSSKNPLSMPARLARVLLALACADVRRAQQAPAALAGLLGAIELRLGNGDGGVQLVVQPVARELARLADLHLLDELEAKVLLKGADQGPLAGRVQHALLDATLVAGARVHKHERLQGLALVVVLVVEDVVARLVVGDRACDSVRIDRLADRERHNLLLEVQSQLDVGDGALLQLADGIDGVVGQRERHARRDRLLGARADVHARLVGADLGLLDLLIRQRRRRGLRVQVLVVACEGNIDLDRAEELVLDMLEPEDGLEGGASGCVHHLLAHVGEIRRPHDEDVLVSIRVLGVEAVEDVAGLLVLELGQDGLVVIMLPIAAHRRGRCRNQFLINDGDLQKTDGIRVE